MNSTATRKATTADYATAEVDARLTAVKAQHPTSIRRVGRTPRWDRIVTALLLVAMAAAGVWAAVTQVQEAREQTRACQEADLLAEAISKDARVEWSELQAIASLYGKTNGRPTAEQAAAVEAPIAAREARVQAAQLAWANARAACQS